LGRRAGALLAAIVLVATLDGCSGDRDDEAPPPPASTTSVPSTTALTPDRPEVRLAPTVSGRPEVLDLAIGPVGNPARAGFVVRVGLETVGGGRSEYPLGEVTTFPSDAPGTFALRLPDDAVRELEAGAKATVVLHLEPVAADMPLPEALRLTVASAVLRSA
jgi:hypothetical protein